MRPGFGLGNKGWYPQWLHVIVADTLTAHQTDSLVSSYSAEVGDLSKHSS